MGRRIKYVWFARRFGRSTINSRAFTKLAIAFDTVLVLHPRTFAIFFTGQFDDRRFAFIRRAMNVPIRASAWLRSCDWFT